MKCGVLCLIKISNFKVGETPLIYRFRYGLATSAWLGRQRNRIRLDSVPWVSLCSGGLAVSLETVEAQWPFPAPK